MKPYPSPTQVLPKGQPSPKLLFELGYSLCKPVIVTNYPTASSQIQEGVDGVIVPMDVDECAQEMAAFIRDKEKQAKIVEYLQTHDYGNWDEIEKIYGLCE